MDTLYTIIKFTQNSECYLARHVDWYIALIKTGLCFQIIWYNFLMGHFYAIPPPLKQSAPVGYVLWHLSLYLHTSIFKMLLPMLVWTIYLVEHEVSPWHSIKKCNQPITHLSLKYFKKHPGASFSVMGLS